MLTYKYRRKLVLTAVCVFTVVTIHSVLLQGNNLHNQPKDKEFLIKTLGKNVTRRAYRSGSFTRVMADNLDHKTKSSHVSNDLDSYVTDLLLNDRSKNITTFIHNKTDYVYVSAKELTQIKENVNDIHLTFNETAPEKKSGDDARQEGNSSQEISTEEDKFVDEEVEDLNNEFDITDLDYHITFPQQKKENQQNQQQQPQENKQAKQISKRNRIKWEGQYDIKLNNTLEYRKQVYEAHVRPVQNRAGINCNILIEKNSEREIEKAKVFMRHIQRRGISTDKYVNTLDCENFRGGRGYIEHPLSQLELDFPLAFEISAYKDVEQAERLLRAVYRPHNYYCFHLDLKMSQFERTAFERIAQCLNNVFITDKSVNVTWGGFSVLEAELLCMEKLWQYKRWKYYINLTGQEFPLKTNREIVAILNSLEGANIVDGTWIRARQKYFYRWTIAGNPPPHGIRPIKGSIHVAVNRHFVDFALHDHRSHDFLEWLKKTQIPDETFFASLNHNSHLGINGSFLGEAEEYPLKPSLMRYKNWEMGHSVFVRSCAGKYVRHICVLGVEDLHKAYSDIGLFVNKFVIDFEYLALDCLEEVLYRKTWDQYLNDVNIDTTYFKHLDYVKRKLFVPPKA